MTSTSISASSTSTTNTSISTSAVRDVREVIRDEHVMRPAILAALADGPLTVPAIADAIGHPSREVMFWVMGLRKYGYLTDLKGADDEGYFLYQATDRLGS